MSGSYVETPYLVYLCSEDGDELRFHRREYVRHQAGETVTRAMLADVVRQAAAEGYYPSGLYRAFPVERRTDFTVEMKVVLA